MKTTFFSIVSAAFLLAGCQAQTIPGVETVPPATFAEKLKATPNAQLLDVRTPGEFAGEHLDNAVNIDWNGEGFAEKAAKYDKSKPVFVYCKIGGRSIQAAHELHNIGFTKIYNLQGGIVKWAADGFAPKSDKIIGMCPQEYAEMLGSDTVLVDFYAEWCEPCQKMKPYLLKMQDELKDKIKIVRLNADENKTMMESLKIDELPALYLYKDKKIVWQHKGFISEDDLKKQLQ